MRGNDVAKNECRQTLLRFGGNMFLVFWTRLLSSAFLTFELG